ncbi:acyl-CoA thioester hydrolase [Acetitomaculum ruminis DSM 5522]|uniref:Acyl-CoA thioester hydrolase n=1 Tax=Acetitomaculum ruminis DSM 5522 TaxID=1120918 RepID=A0A1I1AIB6_9FIRM|nr:acyl-CoA thioesterase [Acetitomaculum ruminis]SFB37076.1 acyl-CoA thioester hydrolase [Acetitomaculum ruminis DSM 5522]
MEKNENTSLQAPKNDSFNLTTLAEHKDELNIEHYLYEHHTQYYETEQSGFIHHSNYIRWFEELREDVLNKMGINISLLESKGIRIPITSVSCDYINPVKYPDIVLIKFRISNFTDTEFTLNYQIINKRTSTLCATGETKHRFMGRNGTELVLSRDYPDYYFILHKYLVDKDD